jgi:TP901 family phage tail tape measure protein
VADRRITVLLQANISDFKSKMSQASNETGKLLDRVQANKASISQTANTMGLLGAAMTAAAGLGVKSFADFDAAMSKVAATGDDARNNLDALREAAIDAGAETVFSATEAAEAIVELEKAGLSSADVLGGGLKGALDMAAASEMSVAQAAEITSSTMNQFGLAGSDAARIADVLAAAAGKANGEVADFGGAMKFIGPIAAQMGVSLEETSGALALLAQNGILGEQAGTSLRGMLISLSSPSAQATKVMQEYGISLYDARGEFVGLTAMVGQLSDKLGPLDSQTRDAALGQLFGNAQLTTARILYAEGAEAVSEWTAAVNDAGFAGEVAAIQMDNLKGDVEKLGGSLETVLIQSGSGANTVLRELVQGANNLVDGIGKIPAPVLQGGLAITGLGGAALLASAGAMKLVVGIADARAAAQTLTTEFPRATAVAGKLSKGLAAAAVAAAALGALKSVGGWFGDQADIKTVQAMTEAMMGELNYSRQLMGSYYDLSLGLDRLTLASGHGDAALDNLMRTRDTSGLFGWVPDLRIGVNGLYDALSTLNSSGFDKFVGRVASSWKLMGNSVDIAEESVSNLDQALAGMVSAGNAEEAAAFVETFAEKAELAGYSAEETAALLPQYNTALEAAANAEAQAGIEAQELAASMGLEGQMTQEAADALQSWRDMAAASFSSFVDIQGAFDDARSAAEGAADATVAGADRSTSALADFAAGAAVSTADFIGQLEAQVKAQEQWATNMGTLTARVSTELPAYMQDAATDMINELMELGPAGAEAVDLIAKMSEPEFAKTVDLYDRKGTAAATEFYGSVAALSPATMGLDADTSTAEQKARDLVNQIAKMNAKVNVDVYQSIHYASGKGAGYGGIPRWMGGPIRGLASGGFVPGMPPANRREDNMLGTTQGGLLYGLQSGEFVSTLASAMRNEGALIAGNNGATLTVASAAQQGPSIQYVTPPAQSVPAAQTQAVPAVTVDATVLADFGDGPIRAATVKVLEEAARDAGGRRTTRGRTW